MGTVNKYGYGVLTPSQGGGGGGKTLEGTNYIYVQANGTAQQNATELLAAYTEAVSRNPSANNKQTIICGNGYYDFSGNFILNTEWIDVVSLDANTSIVFNGNGSIYIQVNNVFVRGVDVGSLNFLIDSGLSNITCQDCIGGDFSFGGDPSFGASPKTISGTFINCRGGVASFAGYGIADGKFIDCVGLNESFGFADAASGTFIRCSGNVSSFGGFAVVDGFFEDCTGGDGSFGDGGNVSGVFKNCIGGATAFAGNCSGFFFNCEGGNGSFGGNTYDATGFFYYCKGGTTSFATIIASGEFYNCIAGDLSFGRILSSGYFNNCVGGEQSFGELAGQSSGNYLYCQASVDSFGGSTGTLDGILYYCRLQAGSFPTPTGLGKVILGVDGSNAIINL